MLLAAWRPDFYAAAASIIPVLLISIALQERYFRTLYWLLGGRKLRTGAARVNDPNHRHRWRELWRRWWIDPPPSDPKQVKPPPPPPPPILRRVVAVGASLS